MCSQYSHELVPHTRQMCFLDGQCWCRSKASWYSDQFSFSVSLLQGLLRSLKSAETPAGPGFYSTWIKLKDILAPCEDVEYLPSCYEGTKTKIQLRRRSWTEKNKQPYVKAIPKWHFALNKSKTCDQPSPYCLLGLPHNGCSVDVTSLSTNIEVMFAIPEYSSLWRT